MQSHKNGQPFNKRKNTSEDQPNTKYRLVSMVDAKLNKHYKQLVEHSFERQALHVFRERVRDKKEKKSGSKTSRELPLLRYIKEPYGLKHKEHASHANTNQWFKLDFSDPDFIRNIFKAFRLGLMNEDRFVTAHLIFDAMNELADKNHPVSLRQYACDDEGGFSLWSPAKISYAAPSLLKTFKENVSKLEEADRNYFIINFSKRRETALFWDWIKKRNTSSTLQNANLSIETMFRFFINHRIDWNESNMKRLDDLIKTNQISDVPTDKQLRKDFFIKKIDELGVEDKMQQAKAKQALQSFLFLNTDIESSRWLTGDSKTKSDRHSAFFLHLLLCVYNEEGPAIAISPDFDGSSDSPLLCMILPTITLQKELLKSLYGVHATMPFFNAGKVSTRLIRYCDEKNQTRPVELTHPDIKFSRTAHGYDVLDFSLEWHDCMFHLMRNGKNQNKIMYRYIKQLLTQVTGFDMSKTIWILSDLDNSTALNATKIISTEAKNDPGLELLRAEAFLTNMEEFFPNCWAPSRHSHQARVMLIDMALNPMHWQNILGNTPEKHIAEATSLLKTMPENKNFTDEFFQKKLTETKTLIETYPGKPFSFYILLDQLANAGAKTILISLDELNLLPEIIEWSRDNGLCFRRGLTDLTDRSIEKLSNETRIEKFHSAWVNLLAKDAKLERTSRLIKLVNTEAKNEMLYYLTKHNQVNIISHLVRMGIDVTQFITQYTSMLHIAAVYGANDVLRFLIQEMKVDINQQSKEGSTAAMFAADCKHIDALRMLVDAKADLLISNQYGCGTIHFAAEKGDTNAVKLLLDHKVPVDHATRTGHTSIHFAAQRNYVATLELLLASNGDSNKRASGNWAPLHLAAKHNAIDTCTTLLRPEFKTEINLRTSDNFNALYYALRESHYELAVLLLLKMDDINLKECELLSKEKNNLLTACQSIRFKAIDQAHKQISEKISQTTDRCVRSHLLQFFKTECEISSPHSTRYNIEFPDSFLRVDVDNYANELESLGLVVEVYATYTPRESLYLGIFTDGDDIIRKLSNENQLTR